MSVEIERSPKFEQNQKHADGELPHCYICGKTIEHPKNWIRIHHGGAYVVNEAEAAQLNAEGHESADMYFFPVGNECLRKRPELKPYVKHFDEAIDLEIVDGEREVQEILAQLEAQQREIPMGLTLDEESQLERDWNNSEAAHLEDIASRAYDREDLVRLRAQLNKIQRLSDIGLLFDGHDECNEETHAENETLLSWALDQIYKIATGKVPPDDVNV